MHHLSINPQLRDLDRPVAGAPPPASPSCASFDQKQYDGPPGREGSKSKTARKAQVRKLICWNNRLLSSFAECRVESGFLPMWVSNDLLPQATGDA